MRDTQASASVGAVRGSSLRGPRERATNPPPVRRRHSPSTQPPSLIPGHHGRRVMCMGRLHVVRVPYCS